MTPPVKGGQGRDDDEIFDLAAALVWLSILIGSLAMWGGLIALVRAML